MKMEIPVKVQFRNLPFTPSLEQKVIERAQKLERYSDRITDCRVMIEASHRHHQYGVIYHVSIELDMPGKKLAVTREREMNPAHKDAWVAIRDAFDAIRRQMADYVSTWRKFDRRSSARSFGSSQRV
jgi:ribosome-associated translation inhibitor RaiA